MRNQGEEEDKLAELEDQVRKLQSGETQRKDKRLKLILRCSLLGFNLQLKTLA